MSQPVAVQRYLQKRAERGPWHIDGSRRRDLGGAVVIPALAESASLFATLDGLRANPPKVLDRFLVLVVVNHRQDADAATRQDNRLTLRRLAEAAADFPGLAWIDAASQGRELPCKSGGVGLARKIGLDLALGRLDWQTAPVLACLDADTLVRSDYLSAICDYFAGARQGAAVVPFCHPLAGDRAQRQAMVAYELYLRCHLLGLQLAGSPYAFHTVGSTMICRALDYVRAGGMNRRQAGEDFYFLQQLAKVGGVCRLLGTVVYPAARHSHRTPFGTGRSVAQLAAAPATPARLYYDSRCYEVLGAWLRLLNSGERCEGGDLLSRAAAIDPALETFLHKEGLAGVWTGLLRNHGDRQRLTAAAHAWFDGLKTVRLVNHLSDVRWPRLAAGEAVPPLLRRAGLSDQGDAEAWLHLLRERQIGESCRFCGLSEKSNYCRVNAC